MDTQTAWVLMPLAEPQNRAVIADPASGGHRFDVLGHRFAVLPEWSFYLAFQAPGQPSLTRFLDGLQAASAGDRSASVMLVSGSFRVNDVFRLQGELRDSGHASVPAAGDSRLSAVVVDIAALDAWRLRHRGQDNGDATVPHP
jgi:hypothetical protein